MHRQFEREVEHLQQQVADGVISQAEFNDEMHELERDFRGAAEEAAEDAYRRELECW